MSSDIRKWFMKQHDKGATASSKPAVASQKTPNSPNTEKPNPVQVTQENSERRKTSKYFAPSSKEVNPQTIIKEEKVAAKTPSKRKPQKSSEDIAEDSKPTLPKRSKTVDDDHDDFMPSSNVKKSPKPDKKMKNSSVTQMTKSSHKVGDNLDDEINDKDPETPVKAGGRGKGGRGSGSMTAGRGRGAGRGGFMNFGERKDPPHKGEKEVPEGAPDCLAGQTFVLSGTLDSLEREEAEDLIKRHGGRITSAVSKKTSFLLADEDVGGRKSSKAKELGIPFLTEDGLFDMIRKSKPAKTPKKEEQNKKTSEKMHIPYTTSSPSKVEIRNDQASALGRKEVAKGVKPCIYPDKRKTKSGVQSPLTWTDKYRPKVPADIIGNQSIVKQLHDWLMHWDDQFLHAGQKVKGKKLSDSGSKKAVLLSGSPGIGKSTSAKLVSQMLGFQAVEVNASDSRGKADTKIVKGVGGNTSNSIKELVSNVALDSGLDWSKPPKSVLIMDEVDGMSAGDRGGVADLIASIKISKIPIICICNDRYSQKLKSLVNYCLALNFRKPTKQQMAKRLKQIADAEGLQINEIALEELAERVSGDMRMAINQLQYMSISQSVINYDDIRKRLLSSAKDEDISPFTAVDKLFGFNGGKLRMDERIDLSMSDPDLVPLIVQENYINYRPSSIGRDDNGVKRMNLLALAAESIGDGDIFNVQIRRYRQWQLSQSSSFASCIIPAALMHGQRETLEPGERNFNRFGGWLGKNSTTGKNLRLLDDVHMHFLSSQEARLDRETLRLEYFTLLLKQLTNPLQVMSKEVAVQKVVEFMDAYSLNQEDFDTIVELSKFKGHPNPMDDIQPAVKSALTKAYKKGSDSRVVRSADLIVLPGLKKAPKKRIAAILEPVGNGLAEENEEAVEDNEEENSDAEDADDLAASIETEQKPQLDLLSNKPKGMQVQLDLKSNGKSNAKKTPASKSRSSGPAEKQAQGSGGRKRKR
ncbi:replication factor C subunit 1-like isoform X1 [Zingiber officinale]|uniref:replication factor C subunit 1-like isoform X1 n=1 Tax=Zingiber officinale TaxID=94328 RepID=UPI001C4B30E6|nr:replication factor C subunit 1-like isoform X1 [Zingiber officinale]XP_042440976.1 replication factor C subunit 1-like isoform X1 [Zingiber officinale]XP_042440977.1 replication factor C subunit 1-like isoform X1 [Zingiber officinale]